MKYNTFFRFQDIIASVDSQNFEQNRQFEAYRCKITLKDGSNLRLYEKYEHEALVYYSYYWLSGMNELIVGWDCAPHHPEINGFPHHKHIGVQGNVVYSAERSLNDILTVIREKLMV